MHGIKIAQNSKKRRQEHISSIAFTGWRKTFNSMRSKELWNNFIFSNLFINVYEIPLNASCSASFKQQIEQYLTDRIPVIFFPHFKPSLPLSFIIFVQLLQLLRYSSTLLLIFLLVFFCNLSLLCTFGGSTNQRNQRNTFRWSVVSFFVCIFFVILWRFHVFVQNLHVCSSVCFCRYRRGKWTETNRET